MDAVEYSVVDGVAIITLNRPDARNAINGALAAGMGHAFGEIVRSADVRVAILTGAGGTFCSGMDLKAFVAGESIDVSGIPFGGSEHRVVEKPLIAAVEGYALAGGFELALTCDLIVASRTAKFGLPEVKRGLVAAGGGLVKLPRQTSLRVANEMVLTGNMYDADFLERHGLVNLVTDEGCALERALELAGRIAENGPLAVAVSKMVLKEALDWPASEGFDRQREFTAPVFKSADALEGATAFAQKRKPRWTAA